MIECRKIYQFPQKKAYPYQQKKQSFGNFNLQRDAKKKKSKKLKLVRKKMYLVTVQRQTTRTKKELNWDKSNLEGLLKNVYKKHTFRETVQISVFALHQHIKHHHNHRVFSTVQFRIIFTISNSQHIFGFILSTVSVTFYVLPNKCKALSYCSRKQKAKKLGRAWKFLCHKWQAHVSKESKPLR